MSKRHVKTVAAAMAMTEKPVAEVMAPRTRGADSLRAMVKVGDSLANVAAALGTDRDKKYYSEYAFPYTLTRVQLENIFRSSWAGKRIVKAVPEDMTREWVSYLWDGADDDDEGRKALREYEQRFDVQGKVLETLTWAGLYGGAAIIMGIAGDETPEAMAKPLNINAIRKDSLRYLHVMDRWRLGAGGELVRDLNDPDFGQPTHYILAESGVRVHRSRMILFHGQRLPYFQWRSNAMWHDSELQHIYDNLRNYDTVTSALATMMFEQNIDVVKNDQVAEAMTVDGGEAALVRRYQGMALMKSFNRLVLIDKEHEEYSRHPNTFTGMDNISEKFMLDLAGAADIPLTRLFGQSPKGFSTGDAELRIYYDRVKAKQVAEMVPQLMRLARVMVPSALGSWPTDFRIELAPLYQMSATDKANVEKTRAERDNIYLQAGVITEGVVAGELQERGTYTRLEDDDVESARGMSENIPATAENVEMAKVGSQAQSAPVASKGIQLTPTATASIITVNEARESMGKPPWPDADGMLTIAEFQAKHGGVIAEAVKAESGKTGEEPAEEKPATPSKQKPPVASPATGPK